MKSLTFNKVNNLSQLHDELLAAAPTLRPRPGTDGIMEPVIRVEGRASEIILTVPDDANESEITAVVTAHVPKPSPPVALTRTQLRAQLNGATSIADIKAVIGFVLDRIS